MKDVVLDEIIDEEIYQNLKKEIGKKDDYLNIEEYEKLRLNYAYYKNNELLKNQQSALNTLERVVGIEPTLSGRKVYLRVFERYSKIHTSVDTVRKSNDLF